MIWNVEKKRLSGNQIWNGEMWQWLLTVMHGSVLWCDAEIYIGLHNGGHRQYREVGKCQYAASNMKITWSGTQLVMQSIEIHFYLAKWFEMICVELVWIITVRYAGNRGTQILFLVFLILAVQMFWLSSIVMVCCAFSRLKERQERSKMKRKSFCSHQETLCVWKTLMLYGRDRWMDETIAECTRIKEWVWWIEARRQLTKSNI